MAGDTWCSTSERPSSTAIWVHPARHAAPPSSSGRRPGPCGVRPRRRFSDFSSSSRASSSSVMRASTGVTASAPHRLGSHRPGCGCRRHRAAACRPDRRRRRSGRRPPPPLPRPPTAPASPRGGRWTRCPRRGRAAHRRRRHRCRARRRRVVATVLGRGRRAGVADLGLADRGPVGGFGRRAVLGDPVGELVREPAGVAAGSRLAVLGSRPHRGRRACETSLLMTRAPRRATTGRPVAQVLARRPRR